MKELFSGVGTTIIVCFVIAFTAFTFFNNNDFIRSVNNNNYNHVVRTRVNG